MRTPRLLLAGRTLQAGPCEFDGDAVHHLARVLRRRPGDAVILCDGAGSAFEGVIEMLDGKRCRVLLERPCDAAESPLQLRLGLALLRGERMDYALQKTCELGVSHIDLLITERVEVRLDGKRLTNRMQHFEGVLAHALQQSGRTRLPRLAAPQRLADWLAGLQASVSQQERRLILDPEGEALQRGGPADGFILASGPEGGFEDGEVTLLAAAGFERVRLGPRVLRAETAPVAALSVLQWLYGDFAG
ncbi:MAG: 16S rRNA (uracil(1498)-N(3))-methyltransferase [Gammaproteobacteria bacterium]|nr:16S rRNA (uracil(1498)-N(3))-methyltransferase [Gammaproteobacteria bacterium]